jgi:hypothetical protein
MTEKMRFAGLCIFERAKVAFGGGNGARAGRKLQSADSKDT